MDQFAESNDLMREWRQMFHRDSGKQPRQLARQSDIWSIEQSPPPSPKADADNDPDCPFEYTDDRPYAQKNWTTSLDDPSQQSGEEDWAMEREGDLVHEMAEAETSDIPDDVSRALTCLDDRVEAIVSQLQKQYTWNKMIQGHIETVAQGYDDIPTLRSIVEKLQERIDILCVDRGDEEGMSERKAGRPKRSMK
ncbi:hypothetical protein N7466_011092 [Penicillium verhagenii]|uniref:uncharacterized protein n=1 Tax=Penicillium verhagenii TaxID=1562060 RepID=UPI002544DA0E|nr:uncharacterized protein N7466_011074 [Penicillium verhagenii]XP_057016213.1 uncharacterized protein N7466_011092 [Penicillium verhagenii]KAJ5917520.1 hypothetical protein N7466_011074 [Penicillium verhagenii]KAJ5917538.1 hypothetical protein N7466_011092 [Penicillium verhagenii]